MFKRFTILIVSILVLLQISSITSCQNDTTHCEDWTLCQRMRCARFPDICPSDKPYKLYSQCGCCEYCSECPRKGPCGTCGKDVVCKERYPTCKDDQIVSIDYCGCCRVCYDALGEGQECKTEGAVSGLCKAGFECIDGKCSARCD